MKSKTICIIGPTASGKTSVAFSLARTLKGEIVNLDKIYTYKNFTVGTGLSDDLKEKGVKKHLYQLIEPNNKIIKPETFAKMIRKTCKEINKRGKWAIIQGGSTTYFPALYKHHLKSPFIKYFFALKFPNEIDLSRKINNRLNQMLKDRLLSEVRMGMNKYPTSLIMNDCHFIVPMIGYLKKEKSLSKAKKEVVKRVLRYIKDQMKCFTSYGGINWITVDSSKKLTTEKISKSLTQ